MFGLVGFVHHTQCMWPLFPSPQHRISTCYITIYNALYDYIIRIGVFFGRKEMC